MLIEWIFVLTALATGLLVARQAGRGMPRSAGRFLAAVGLAGLVGLGVYCVRLAAGDAERDLVASLTPGVREDGGFVGSDSCRACHPGEHASWHKTYHRTMTQRVTPETVRGDFDDVSLRFHGRNYKFEREGDQFFVEMIDPDWEYYTQKGERKRGHLIPDAPYVRRRVVMSTGSHHYQVYWVPGRVPNQLHFVPVVYHFAQERWIPRNAAFLEHPAFHQSIRLWNDSCVECHATAGQPKTDFREADTRVAELGISCEACHGPGAEHVARHRNPVARYRALSDDELDPTIVNPANLPHDRSTHVCGQCHIVGFIADPERLRREGFEYRPGEDLLATRPPILPSRADNKEILEMVLEDNPRFVQLLYWKDGEVRVAGREFNAMSLAPCYERGKMSCLSCHSMHDSDPNDQLIRSKMDSESCLQCHESFREDPSAHTHHPAGSSGSNCLNCHMAHTTYGLLGAVRSHAIQSPNIRIDLETGRPNACNLCHLDKTVAWTGEHLTKWYGQPKVELDPDLRTTAAGPLWTLKGDAGVRALAARSFGWGPAQEASRTGWMAPYLSQLLVDPYAAVRYIAQKSLRTIPEYEHISYDYIGSSSLWIRTRQYVEQIWADRPKTRKSDPGLLLDDRGFLERERFESLQKRRDRTPMSLNE